MAASLIDRMRREAGQVLGAISDDEVMHLAGTFQKNGSLVEDHDFRRFDGDALVFVAGQGGPMTTPGQGDDDMPAASWRPYVSGEISQIHLPCSHWEMIQPDMLGEVWTGISTWLGLE